MKEIKINENWTFEDAVNHIKTLKFHYDEVLASFSYFEIKAKVEFMRKFKKEFYSLKMKEWRVDKLWDYINGYETYNTLKFLVERDKKNERNNKRNDGILQVK